MQSSVISKGIVKTKGRNYFLLFALFILARSAPAQMVSLSLKEEPIEKAFRSIESQTSFRFIYSKETIKAAKPVTVQFNKVSLQEALARIFSGQPLGYSLEDLYIMVKAKAEADKTFFEYRGRVIDEEGAPIMGVNVTIKATSIGAITDSDGEFFLKNATENSVLIFSYVGREKVELPVNSKTYLVVRLKNVDQLLDETIIQAYGTTTRRLSTGNISKVSSEDISKQPVTNPLAALEGRVPGMFITQSSGLAGSSFKVQVRGRTTIDPSITDDQPLFIIDGVPYAPNNGFLNTLNSALGTPSNSNGVLSPGGLSPFASINPQDIESIEVLKDADATAIYGSRGANGVVLITTKRGRAGKSKYDFMLQSGVAKPTRILRMLNSDEYIQMRKEAFFNDSVSNPSGYTSPSVINAYDFLLWNPSRYTDLSKLLIGETAKSMDAQASISGGNAFTQFLIGTNYHHESDVFAGGQGATNSSIRFNLVHTNSDNRFNVVLSSNYAYGVNNSYSTDLTSLLEIPPNILLYDSAGKLAWNEGGVISGWNNPLSYIYSKYSANTRNFVSTLDLSFKITKAIYLKLNGGYNALGLEEQSSTPMSSLNPLQNSGSTASFTSRNFNSYILEPHFDYTVGDNRNKLDFLLGGTWQGQKTSLLSSTGSGYVDDALLGSLSGATNIIGSRNFSEYKYEAVFGRIIYSRLKRYILNLSARRDGSSRFGEDRRFAEFGSVGGAWIFTDEKVFKKAFSFLSFGKLRASAGITGNDKISDYLYLDTWRTTPNSYQGSTGLMPTKLYNPDYRWEKTTKLELGLDLGFLSDRFLISASWYRHRSSNQLINYKLPSTTGFSGVVKNLNALVENTGVEISLVSTPVKTKDFLWNASINFTIPQNKLVRFPGLASSSYANTYIIGHPLNLIYGYRNEGVDAQKGIFVFEDKNKDSSFSAADRQPLGNLDPKFYGGLNNSVQLKQWQLDFFWQFVSQTGTNFLSTIYSAPGTIRNMPDLVLQRWRKEGDKSLVQQFSQNGSFTQPAYNAFSLLSQSNGIYSNASYARLKTITLSYQVGEELLHKAHLNNGTAYITAQNLITLTNYKGGDPETQNYLRLPPLKTIVLGVRFSF